MLSVTAFCVISGILILKLKMPFVGFTVAFAVKFSIEIVFNLVLIFKVGWAYTPTLAASNSKTRTRSGARSGKSGISGAKTGWGTCGIL